MSKTLIYRMNKDFDQYSNLLKNLLNVQESREDSKSPTIRQTNRKKQQQFTSINTRTKKQNSKINGMKSSFNKTSPTNEKQMNDYRTIYSNLEESLTKNCSNQVKVRKTLGHSLSPTQSLQQRSTSPTKKSLSLVNNVPRQRSSPIKLTKTISSNDENLIRSLSDENLPSSKNHSMEKQSSKHFLSEQLNKIQTIAKQIQNRNSSDCPYLWNRFDKILSTTISSVNDDQQFQTSLQPLRNEIHQLTKQLRNTNIHLNEYDVKHHQTQQYVELQKKFDANQNQCRDLLLQNEQLKTKCHLLEDKLDYFERNNIRLIQRLTQQDIHTIAKRTEWISTDDRFLLCEEVLFLKEKLYHVYDDISILLNRNQQLEKSVQQQKQQISLYKQQSKDLKETARDILDDLNHRVTEEKMRTFFNKILSEQNQNCLHVNQILSTPIKSSQVAFENQNVTLRSSNSLRNSSPTKLRPKSLFVTPNILNDTKIVSNLQNHRNSMCIQTKCLSSTVNDADSTTTSSTSSSSLKPFQYEKQKQIHSFNNQQTFNINESGPELDQISDLTSKMFTSADEEDMRNNQRHLSTSSSSSSFLSDAEKIQFL